VSFGILICNFF